MSALDNGMPKLPTATLWMTGESKYRLMSGGNSKGAVPVHGKRSATANIPLFTMDQLQSCVNDAFAFGLTGAAQSDTTALRDDFAGKAMGALISAIMPQECHRWTNACFAQEAYALADSMLAERAKP